jgi:hypothetical protein
MPLLTKCERRGHVVRLLGWTPAFAGQTDLIHLRCNRRNCTWTLTAAVIHRFESAEGDALRST